MTITQTEVKDVYILQPKVFGDARGWFTESYNEQTLQKHGLSYTFVQDNHSFSAQSGTLRGLHVQKGEAAQAKIVRCVAGEILDVAVDLREGSPTYLKWTAVKLTADNFRQLLIPRGFAHGFLTLCDNVQVMYKADNVYNPKEDCSIAWNDPDIGVEWGIQNPILSDKDKSAPRLKDSEVHFDSL